MHKITARWLVFLAFAPALHAGDRDYGNDATTLATGNKGSYHLFNPVPVEQMREMSTDRPDTTESPITVDAGHFQIESSLFDYGRDKNRGEHTEVFTYGSFNLKAGLWNNADIQFIFDSYVDEQRSLGGVEDNLSGFSDVQTRFKLNLWGNEGGATALAIMPYVKAPTGTALSNDAWEGGIIVPFGFEITENIVSAIMAEVDWVYDDITGDYETEWVHSATVGISVTDQVGLFTEYVGVSGSHGSFDYQASFNTGVTFAVSENMILDTGIRVGITDAAEDFGFFTGISVRH